jgi:hypothetical protein
MREYTVVGRKADGDTVYYTGRAGERFVSDQIGDSFGYLTLDGARNRAKILNVGSPMHGIWFHVPYVADGAFSYLDGEQVQ